MNMPFGAEPTNTYTVDTHYQSAPNTLGPQPIMPADGLRITDARWDTSNVHDTVAKVSMPAVPERFEQATLDQGHVLGALVLFSAVCGVARLFRDINTYVIMRKHEENTSHDA